MASRLSARHCRWLAAILLLLLPLLACNLISVPYPEAAATDAFGPASAGDATSTAVLLPPTEPAVDAGDATSTAVPPSPTEPAAVAAACDAVVQEAIARIDDVCSGTARNEACYGHARVMVLLQPGATGIFSQPRDRIALSALSRLDTSAFDPNGDLWGIALLRVQADLPDALPGEAITFIAYGDTTIEDAGGAAPMQAVSIRTGLGDPTCASAPEAAVLIQNESEEVASLTINGVDLLIGSTLLVQARPESEMKLAVLEGQVDATVLGGQVSAVAGAQISVPLSAQLEPLQPPRLEPLDLARLQARPIASLLQTLPRRVAVPTVVPDLNARVQPLRLRLPNSAPASDGSPQVLPTIRIQRQPEIFQIAIPTEKPTETEEMLLPVLILPPVVLPERGPRLFSTLTPTPTPTPTATQELRLVVPLVLPGQLFLPTATPIPLR